VREIKMLIFAGIVGFFLGAVYMAAILVAKINREGGRR